jgi:hypothetical protein
MAGTQNAVVSVAASQTDSVIKAAFTGKRINVLAVAYVGGTTAAAVTFNSKGSGAGTAIGPAFVAAASTPVVLPYNPKGWFQTNAGEALTVTTGASVTATTITVTYEVIS